MRTILTLPCMDLICGKKQASIPDMNAVLERPVRTLLLSSMDVSELRVLPHSLMVIKTVTGAIQHITKARYHQVDDFIHTHKELNLQVL